MSIRTVALYGSRARGDQTEGSDTDLLMITDEPGRPRHSTMGQLSLSVYPDLEIERRALEGDLFVWHVLLEGRAIYDPDHALERYRRSFQPRASYADEQSRGAAVAWMLSRFADQFAGSALAAKRAAWSVRTILIARSAEKGPPVFASEQLCERAPISEARRLIAQKDTGAFGISTARDLGQFLNWVQLPDPSPSAKSPDGYAPVFESTSNAVGAGLLRQSRGGVAAGDYG